MNVDDQYDQMKIDRYIEDMARIEVFEVEITITCGEYEHSETIYSIGSFYKALATGNRYLSTIWGEGETFWNPDEEAWMNKGETLAARLGTIRPFDSISAFNRNGRPITLKVSIND